LLTNFSESVESVEKKVHVDVYVISQRADLIELLPNSINAPCSYISFKEFSALDAHPGWHPITSNAHHFHTILTKDFENLMAYI
jgi:hypothetical protein